ncbi:MAG: YraN family protein [Clostridia bacterium]|jgi:putative endonuclease|nr:YraN family protein [Clostridia bacterium]
MSLNKEEGKLGERVAVEYLKEKGYEIICQNFACRQGEIDIVAKDRKELVFIEVKTRKGMKYGEAREAVHNKKLKHILGTASYYLYKTNQESAYIRIDVIEVYLKQRRNANKPHKTSYMRYN